MLVISADKTTNFYQMSPAAYNKLVTENVTAVYKRAQESDIIKVTNEAKNIADELNLGDRIESLAKKEAFITLRDHKKNFDTKPKCRLINPAKSELGRISKVILDRVNSEVISQTGINQWKNSSAVLYCSGLNLSETSHNIPLFVSILWIFILLLRRNC